MTTAFRVGVSVGATSLAILLATSSARADAAGDKVLAAMDEAMNRAKSHYLEYDVTNQEPGKAETKLALIVRMKGEKRLTQFTAPADMKGTKVLVLSSTQMYVYLPAFGKVRRIASGVSDQGFMGMTFSADDFQTRYSDVYTANLASEDASVWRLVATPKAGQQTPYAKIEFTVAKDKTAPTEIKYFNAANTNVKTETRSNYTCQGNVCAATEDKMVDNTKGGAWTKMIRKTWKVNEALSDDLFTKRALEK
jgi:outer membrane lipoprotein-sorting protein